MSKRGISPPALMLILELGSVIGLILELRPNRVKMFAKSVCGIFFGTIENNNVTNSQNGYKYSNSNGRET